MVAGGLGAMWECLVMGEPYRLALRVARLRYLPACLGLAALVTGGLAVVGCSSSSSDPFAGVGSPMYQGTGPLPKGGGRYHVGKPYEVGGQRYYPQEVESYDKVGMASWYGPKFHRRMTSNGEWFDQDAIPRPRGRRRPPPGSGPRRSPRRPVSGCRPGRDEG
jgi:hypothetical protein